MAIKDWLKSMEIMIFPENCLTCQKILSLNEDIICVDCRISLPQTKLHLEKENHLTQKLTTFVPINTVAAFLKYQTLGKVQILIHALKYYKRADVGEMLGNWYGKILFEENWQEKIEVILPVPLHPKKLKKRGYNQSAAFGKGLANALQIEMREDILLRSKNTDTQTKKDKMERWENVAEIFEIKNQELIFEKKIALIDDVITTGATIVECINAILPYQPAEIYIIAIAAPSKEL